MSKPHPDWNLNSNLLAALGGLLLLFTGLVGYIGDKALTKLDAAAAKVERHDLEIDTEKAETRSAIANLQGRMYGLVTREQFQHGMQSLANTFGAFDGVTPEPHTRGGSPRSQP